MTLREHKACRECRKCGQDFLLLPGKPGLIVHCPDCSKEKVAKVGGNMVWEHKTAPYIEVKSMAEAQVFARLTKRVGGVGVTRALTQPKNPFGKDTGNDE